MISAAILSTTSIFIRHLTQTYHLPALILAFWQNFFIFLTLLPILALGRRSLLRLDRQNLGYLMLYGLVLAIFNSLWTLSVSLNGEAISTVLAYCSAGFTAVLGWWSLKDRLNWGKILAVALSLAGCLLVSSALIPAVWRLNLLGEHLTRIQIQGCLPILGGVVFLWIYEGTRKPGTKQGWISRPLGT